MPRIKNLLVLPILASILAASAAAQYPGAAAAPLTDEQKLLEATRLIRSETLFEYVKELTSETYGGRLTGTAEYDACADWVISLMKKWGVAPGGDDGTYLQKFPNPYTLVFPGGTCVLHLPVKDGTVKKFYKFEEEFIPGGTSASGEVTAEVVFVGYGITAPELGYDDYAGLDVKGKIVLMDPEVPVRPGDPAGAFCAHAAKNSAARFSSAIAILNRLAGSCGRLSTSPKIAASSMRKLSETSGGSM